MLNVTEIGTPYNRIMRTLITGTGPGRPTDAVWQMGTLFPKLGKERCHQRVQQMLAMAGLGYDGYPLEDRCGAYVPTSEEQTMFHRIIEDAKAQHVARLAGAA